MRHLVLVLACAAICAAPASAQDEEWIAIKSWQGSGIKNTESFDVPTREWRVRWTTRNEVFAGASLLQVYVHNASNDNLITLAANVQGTGSDVSYVRATPGRFYLTISSANVDWDIRVEVPRSALR